MTTKHSSEAGTDSKVAGEKFSIQQDPNNFTNWGIVWEHSGTEGGYTSEFAARKSANAQNGTEAEASESQAWNW